MTDPALMNEIRELAGAFAAGRLTSAQTARLNDVLRASPAARRCFLEEAGFHARLAAQFGPGPALAPNPPAPVPTRRRSWRTAGIAGALAAVLAVAVALVPTARPVAVLRNVAGARWASAACAPGAPLGPGLLRLTAGVAEIEFDGGAVALLEGPAELELAGPRAAFLHSGKVVVRGTDSGAGFRLDTPSAHLTERGTEFGVSVPPDASTLLQVYEGMVVADPARPDAGVTATRVENGRAVRITGAAEDVPFAPAGFVRHLPGPDDPTGRGKMPYNRPRFDAVHVVPPPGPVTIDADLGDWDLSGEFRTECEPPYGEAYHLTGAMMYDARFLYVAARVGDPFPMRSLIDPAEKRELYGGGGAVALRVSTDRRAGWPLTAEGADARAGRPATAADLSDKLSFVVLWHHRPTGQACLHLKHRMDFRGARVNPPGYRGAYREAADGRGYTLEYAIPWALLNAADDPPRAGETLAASWLAHWAGADGRTWHGQLIDVVNPRESGWNFQRAATWGKAVYHAAGRLPPGTVAPLP